MCCACICWSGPRVLSTVLCLQVMGEVKPCQRTFSTMEIMGNRILLFGGSNHDVEMNDVMVFNTGPGLVPLLLPYPWGSDKTVCGRNRGGGGGGWVPIQPPKEVGGGAGSNI